MAVPAATMAVLVQAKGITELGRQLSSVDGDLRKTAGAAGKASKDLEDTGKRGSKAMGLLKSAGKIAAGGVAVAGGGALIAGKKFLSLASDAEETASKFRTVFGKETPRAISQLDAFSRATGTSKFALRDQAAQLQALIRPMGMTTKEASGMSVGMTKLATDLASFNNTSVDEAITALQSGLVGEAEPLRRFGVQLSAARIETFAYAKGIAKQGEELTAAQKAQASYGIIMEDTKLAQGDATKTAGSFANQVKRAKSMVTDIATELGMRFKPAALAVVQAFTDFVDGARSGTGAGGALVSTFKTLGSIVSRVVGFFRDHTTVSIALASALTTVFLALRALAIIKAVQTALIAFQATTVGAAFATGGLTAAMTALKAAMLANPVFIVVAALAALVAIFIVAYKESETFRDIVNAVWAAIKNVAVGAWNVIKGVFDAILRYYSTVFEVGKKVIGALVDGIRATASAIAGAAGWVKDRIVQGIQAYLGTYKTVGGWIINRLKEGVVAVGNFAGDVGGWVKNRVTDGVQAFVGGFRTVGGWIVNRIADGIKAIAGFASDIGGWIKNRVVDGIRTFAGAIGDVGGWITNKVVAGAKSVAGVAGDIGGWLRERVDGAWDTIKGAAENLGDRIGRTIRNAVKGGLDGLVSGIKSVLNEMIGVVNKAISGFNKLPGPNIGKIPELYTGVRNFRGGMALVGERGPELVNLPAGSDVYNARDTRAMASSGPGVMYADIYIGGEKIDERVEVQLRRRERANAGVYSAGVLA